MNASQMIAAMDWVEVSSEYEADTRRMILEERESLTAAVKSGDGTDIQAAMAEAQRVATMWGVDLARVKLPQED